MRAAEYFTAGSTFIFLPGNHSSLIGINLTYVTNITLRGASDSSTYILCKNEVSLLFGNAADIYIEGLVFMLFPKSRSLEPSALRQLDVSSVSMHGVSFFGSGGFARAVHSEHSTSEWLQVVWEWMVELYMQ